MKSEMKNELLCVCVMYSSILRSFLLSQIRLVFVFSLCFGQYYHNVVGIYVYDFAKNLETIKISGD